VSTWAGECSCSWRGDEEITGRLKQWEESCLTRAWTDTFHTARTRHETIVTLDVRHPDEVFSMLCFLPHLLVLGIE